MATDILQGFQYARRDPTLFCLVIMSFVPALIGFPTCAAACVGQGGPERAVRRVGMLLMCMGVGSLAGTLILGSIRGMKRRGTFLVVNSFVWGVALIVFSGAVPFHSALPMLFVVGLLSSVFMALNMTLIQGYSSTEMRGRMVQHGHDDLRDHAPERGSLRGHRGAHRHRRFPGHRRGDPGPVRGGFLLRLPEVPHGRLGPRRKGIRAQTASDKGIQSVAWFAVVYERFNVDGLVKSLFSLSFRVKREILNT